jgi:Flp pilus assembly protein TadG
MRIPRFSGPRRRREKGSITMEMALAMPVFLLLIAGVVDLSMLYWEKHVVTNAAREGARAASKAGNNGMSDNANLSISQVKTTVQTYLRKFGIKNLDGTDITLTDSNFAYTVVGTPPDTLLTVKLNNIPYKMMLLPNIKTLFGESRTSGDDAFYLTAQTSMAAQWKNPPSP